MKEITLREHLARIGSIKTSRKKASSKANALKAAAAHRSTTLERAYRAVADGKLSLTAAARDPGKCSYYTLRDYVQRRKAGETAEQINRT